MVIKFSRFKPKVNTYKLGSPEGICKAKMIDSFNLRKLGREYGQQFEPIRLTRNKPYALFCLKDGRLVVANEDFTKIEKNLPEGEYTLYRYYCFLSTLYMWQCYGIEINAPIVFDDLFERLDESINRKEIINKASELNATIYFKLGEGKC